MDPYAFISPDPVTGPGMFGDDDPMDYPLMDNIPADMFIDAFNDAAPMFGVDALPLSAVLPTDQTDPFNTPPLSGFDGYLAGNIDFDENLLANPSDVDLAWGALDMYNLTSLHGFVAPPPPSSASESQGLSPVDNPYLPYTPPEVPAFTPPMIAPWPSDASIPSPPPPSSPSKTDKKSTSTASLGPKRQLRKLIKPETCPICGKGHAQLRERDRHIVTHHYDDAVRMGLNVDRPECQICGQSFRRKDHLTRHMKRRHGA